MTTFVRLGEEDQAYDLVIMLNRVNAGHTTMEDEYVERKAPSAASVVAGGVEEQPQEDYHAKALAAAKSSKLGKLVKERKLTALMNEFFKASDKVFACDADVVDAVFSLALSLFILVAGEPKAIKEYADRFRKLFSKDTKTHPVLRLQLLSMLFNVLDASSKLRYDVMVAILTYAIATKQASLLAGHLDSLDRRVELWKLNEKEEGVLLKLMSQICGSEGQADKAQAYLYAYLKKVDGKSDNSKLEADAVTVVLNTLRYERNNSERKPHYEYDSCLNLSSVQALDKSKTHKPLYELLQIFATGTVSDFGKYSREHSIYLSSLEGLGEDLLLSKLRTLTICSLGLKQERLPYSLLCQKLDLANSEEVEEVVISAVTTGKLEAKIDQETEEVVVQRANPRTFQKKDWELMQKKLAAWKNGVGRVLSTIQTVNHENQNAGINDEGY